MHTDKYIPYPEIILRSPLLSVSSLAHIPEDLEGHFLKLLGDDFFCNSIYLASPDLYQKALQFKAGDVKSSKDKEKLLLSLLRYWLRMSARCTPFGLFAGCSLVNTETVTKLLLNDKKSHVPYSRLDMNHVCELSKKICSVSAIRKQLIFFPNNSLYKVDKCYRYIEYVSKNGIRNHVLREIDVTSEIERILATAHNGSLLSSLARSIVNDNINQEEATDFINELIDNQILISELDPVITGDDFFSLMINKLRSLHGTEQIVDPLEAIRSNLESSSAAIPELKRIFAQLKLILPEIKEKNLVQTDLFLSFSASTISKAVIQDIIADCEKMFPLFQTSTVERLDQFKTKFRERYEAQEMPLLQVIDSEVGIGYDVHTGLTTNIPVLLDGIDIRENTGLNALYWGKFNEFKLEKLNEAIEYGRHEICLSEAEIKQFGRSIDFSKFPDSTCVFGTLLARDPETLDKGQYQFILKNSFGPSSANLLGRFCQGDKALASRVMDYLSDEEQFKEDAIFAEVVHLPQSRTGNIVSRPILRKYEIPYLTNPGVSADHQIPASDIMVSVKGGSIYLRSKKLNRRIIPRLSSAHNYTVNSLPVYKFLCDNQQQNSINSKIWDWGILKECPFLPRVTFGRIIIKRAQWLIKLNSFDKKNKDNSEDLLAYVKEFRERYNVPGLVQLMQGDNELVLDLNNISCQKLLCETLRKNRQVQLIEFLSTSENCFVENRSGEKFTNEIIVPLKKDVLKQSLRPQDKSEVGLFDVPTPRSFIVGSEWLYVKVYCGISAGERILKEVLKPLVETLKSDGIIDKWFFIRYYDQGYHLRVRFHGRDGFWQEVLDKINLSFAPLIQSNIAYKIQADTYEREIERYGYVDYQLTETIFCIDSECVIDFIQMLDGDSDEKFRWLFAMRGVDALLEDFQLQIADKLALLESLHQSYLSEAGNTKQLRVQLDNSYREKMKTIRSFMNPADDEANEIVEAVEIFKNRSDKLRPIVSQIKTQLGPYEPASVNSLLKSYVHMFLNRLFVSNQRQQELVVYYFLYKYYNSVSAIKKKSTEMVSSLKDH